jgi:hypothetical protein
MRHYFVTTRMFIITSLMLGTLIAASANAADQSPGAGIPDIMGTQPSMQRDAATTEVAAQATWLNEIRNSLDVYKANYPSSNFAPYQTKLNLVGDALNRGDRRAVKVEMSTFFKMLAKRAHGINEGAADELSNFAQMVTPIQEYGIPIPKSGAEQYGSEVPSSGSSQ